MSPSKEQFVPSENPRGGGLDWAVMFATLGILGVKTNKMPDSTKRRVVLNLWGLAK